MEFVNGVFKSVTSSDDIYFESGFIRLTYKTMSLVFFASFALSCLSFSISNAFICGHFGARDVDPMVTSYCWQYSFIITNPGSDVSINTDKTVAQQYKPAMGVVTSSQQIRTLETYRLFPLLCILHGLSFCIPHLIWNFRPKNGIRRILKILDSSNIQNSQGFKDCWRERRSFAAREVHKGLGSYSGCGVFYILVQSVNLVIIFLNLACMDFYTDTGFLGLRMSGLLPYDDSLYPDLRLEDILFPTLVRCEIMTGSLSGSHDTFEYLCHLPHAKHHMVILTLAWDLMLILFVVNYCSFCSNCSLVLVRSYRLYRLSGISVMSPFHRLKKVSKKVSYGDFIFLSILAQNLDKVVFSQLMDDISCIVDVESFA